MKMADMPKQIYQIKITLRDTHPPVWRRLLIPSGITFLELHDIIQAAFGWEDCHLFQFRFQNTLVSPTDDEVDRMSFSDEKLEDAQELCIDGLLESEQTCVYEYDFGDGWMHKIVLEKVLEPAPDAQYPICMKGKRRCPPEDVGGAWGYADFLEKISDPENPEREELLEWATGNPEGAFDSEYFSVDETNEALAELKKSAQGRQRTEPTMEQWEKLYEVAGVIKQLQPWESLWDSDTFTIELPGRDEPVYISVMGRHHECYGINVYPGYEAMLGYIKLRNAPEGEPEIIRLGIQDCLMCNYGNRDEVTDEDRAVLKQLNLKFRGNNQWIYFRSVKPGFIPWFLKAEEADLLIQALQNFVMAYKSLAGGKLNVNFEKGETLLRWYEPKKKLWLNTARELVPFPVELNYYTFTNEIYLKKLKQKRQTQADLSLDMLYIPNPVQEKKTDVPYFPRLVILANNKVGTILAQRMLGVEDDLTDALLDLLDDYILKQGRPAVLRVRDERTGCSVEDICKKIGVKLIQNEGLPVVDNLAESLMGMFNGGPF